LTIKISQRHNLKSGKELHQLDRLSAASAEAAHRRVQRRAVKKRKTSRFENLKCGRRRRDKERTFKICY